MLFGKSDQIIKVVFYEVEIDGVKYQEAAVFRESGMTIESKEAGVKALLKLSKSKGFRTMAELENSNCYEVLKEEKLKKKYPGIHDMVVEDAKLGSNIDGNSNIINNSDNFDEDEIDDDFEEEVSFFGTIKDALKNLKIRKFVARVGLITLAGLATFGGFKLGKKLVGGSDKKSATNNEQTSNDKVVPLKDEKVDVDTLSENTIPSYNSVNEILEKAEINPTKAEALSKVWNYLSYYNDTVASKHISSSTTTKLAHTWDEVMVYYLAYNNISKDEASKLFDNYNIPVDTFTAAYDAAVKQDVLAYKVITEPTHKEELIKSETGKEFYKKYENMIIEFNQTKNDNDAKKRIVDEFYREIRTDYKLGDENVVTDDYKLSVIPMIKAFGQLSQNIESEYVLTEKEVKNINKLSKFSQISEKITVLSDSVYSYNLAQQALQTETDEYLYADIKDKAIEELTNKGVYFVSEEGRNIKDHEEYKKNLETKSLEQVASSDEKEESSKKNTTKKQNTVTSTTVTQTQPVTDNSDLYAGVIEDDDKEDVIPDWMLEENDQEQEYEEEVSDDVVYEVERKEFDDVDFEQDERVKEEIIEVEPDTPLVRDDNLIIEEFDIEYNDEYIDDNGNLDNSVIDITDDVINVSPTDELPDPNNNDSISSNSVSYESVAESIVEDMANNPIQVDDVGYQYTR